MNDVENTKYIEYNNSIRFVAIIGVLLIHISAYGLTNKSIDTVNWYILTFFNCFGRIAVPFFVMIAGAIWLNLDKNVTLNSLLTKNIKKMLIVFLSWAWIYAITYLIGTGASWNISTIVLFVKRCFIGHYHMWYIQMMVALYLIIPMIRQITLKKELYYLLWILSFVTGFIFPMIIRIPILSWISDIVDNIEVFRFSPFILYLLLGDYIRKMRWNNKRRYVLYVLAIVAFIARFGILIASKQGYLLSSLDVNDYGNFLLLLQSVGLYVLIKHINSYFSNSKLIALVSKYSFFIYISHDLVLELLFILGINASLFNSLILTPIIVVFTILFCILIGRFMSGEKWFQTYYL